MKAYQLKIMIKNSRPSIWRRCVVPAGITFSQLGVILNEIMGWSGYHLSAFEFYHAKLRFEEIMDDIDSWYDYEVAESADYIIDYYMENEKWFTYIYDFGDDWTHRVTIEDIILNFDYNYPVVLKYKGNCPPEDCGGIDGYYEILDQQLSEHRDNKSNDMMNQANIPMDEEYDMDMINNLFQENFTIQYVDKPDSRGKDDLYEILVFHGGNNLNVVKNGKRVKVKTKNKKSKQHEMDCYLNQLIEMLKLKNDSPEVTKLRDILINKVNDTPNEQSIEEMYNTYTKQDIQIIARFHSIKYYSSLNKANLVLRTIETILDKNYFTSFFACLRDEEIDVLMRAMKGNLKYEEFYYEIARIYEAGYCMISSEGYIVISSDVQKIYKKINTESFHEIRKKRSSIYDCLTTAYYLYGKAPLDVISTMFRNYTGSACFINEIIAEAEAVPFCLKNFVILENQYNALDLLMNNQLENLYSIQGNKEFYIPLRNEIYELASRGYISSNNTIHKFQDYLIENIKAPFKDAVKACRLIQREIMMECKMQKIFDILESLSIRLLNDKQLHELVPLINEVWNNTRMITNRGFTPNELIDKERKYLSPLPNTKANDYNLTKNRKVYPNDLCSCGSGKKYKHCCGRR